MFVFSQVSASPRVSHEPLSWVPPWMIRGSCGLTDSVKNWSVVKPSFSGVGVDGTFDSICRQQASWGAERPRLGQTADRSVSAPLDRIRPPSEASQNTSGLSGWVTSACWSRVQLLRMDVVGDVLGHVVPAVAAVHREDDAAVVRDLLAVHEDAADVDDVGMAGRAVDDLVVPALADLQRGVRAEALDRPARIRDVRARLLRERRRAGGVLRRPERRVDQPRLADLHVDARLAVRELRDRELGPLREARRRPWSDRREDLRPVRAAVRRAPHAAGVRARVDDVRVVRIERDTADAARRARGRSRGIDRDVAVGLVRRAVVEERPRAAAVGRLVEAPLRRARNQRHGALGRRRDASGGPRGRGVDRVRVARLHGDRPDRPADEGVGGQLRPVVAAVRRLVEADARGCDRRRVRLAGADVERAALAIVRVERDRADRVQLELLGDVLPPRVVVEPLLRAPDPAAGRPIQIVQSFFEQVGAIAIEVMRLDASYSPLT